MLRICNYVIRFKLNKPCQYNNVNHMQGHRDCAGGRGVERAGPEGCGRSHGSHEERGSHYNGFGRRYRRLRH